MTEPLRLALDRLPNPIGEMLIVTDEVFGFLAAIFACGVANFPTGPAKPDPCASPHAVLHAICATLLFLVLACLCLFLFPKTTPGIHPTVEKIKRNRVYYACGFTMVVSLALCGLATPYREPFAQWHKFFDAHGLLFYFETICLFAFGIAWMVKGQTILKDKSPTHTRTRTTDNVLGTGHPG